MTFALTISEQIVFNGVVVGLVYGLLAIGIVLVFRASGVINFAQGQFGAFGATLMAVLYVNEDIPFLVTVPLAIISGAVIGGLTELLVVRRLFHQPRLLLFVATVGIAQVILLLQIQLPQVEESVAFPTPIEDRWQIGALTIRGDQLLVLVAVPLIAVLFAFVLQRTKFGLSVRSAADNPRAASLAGIRVRALSTQVWIVSGVLASVSALLAGPVLNQRASDVTDALGPSLLLYALAAALVGSMTSFPLALLGGVLVGVIDRVVLANSSGSPGLNTLVVFILLIVFVLLRARSQSGDDSSWSLTPRTGTGRQELLRHPLARVLRWSGIALLLALAVLLPRFETLPSRLIDYSTVLIFLMVAVSATVLTGWAGQLSLGQFAFVAVGAYLTAYYSESLGYLVCVGLGTLWGVGVAIAIGIPALRVRGLYLGIITLGFALTVSSYVILQDRFNTSFTGLGARLDPPVLFGYDLGEDKQAYYYTCLVAALVVIVIVSHFRRTGMGRSLLAVRDNETNAAAYTVSPTRAKLIAFAISGGVAAFAGGLFAAGHTTQIPDYFAPVESLRVLAISVVGGLSSVTGAVLGTLVIVAIPTVFEGSAQLQLFASGVGMLILLLYCPGGLISIVDNLRDQLLAFIARRTDWKPPQTRVQASVAELSERAPSPSSSTPALVVRDLRVAFGGRPVVDGVSLEVRGGEVVGLIGTNGAGKTTIMNAICGFVKSSGEIEVFGSRVDGMASYRRARRHVGRAFQNAQSFGGLTVRETIMVGLEARQRSLLVPSLLAIPPSGRAERRKRRQADEIIGYLGLGRYADTLMLELSTGTRRIVEFGALLALDARLILLDEPTAGVAQRETETFGPLIKTVQKELGSSILIVEHDMPMVMSISDRIYCLEAGQVIAEGEPHEVRENPRVISSYLGTDERAIQRSGERAARPESGAPTGA